MMNKYLSLRMHVCMYACMYVCAQMPTRIHPKREKEDRGSCGEIWEAVSSNDFCWPLIRVALGWFSLFASSDASN